MKELHCPNCDALTVRDEHNVFERCLNCGWVREIEFDDERLKSIGIKIGGGK